MTRHIPATNQVELQLLLEFTARVGNDPLLTQASTGNSSAKLDDILWIKASGKWMADAKRDEILIPLDLTEIVTECLRKNIDPSERYPGASLETAMHAALPHRVVLHVHSVNTIAWAVRSDALGHLHSRLEGMHWKWVPYTASGLPLSRELEHVLSAWPETDIFVLGNHGLVIGGQDAMAVERLLMEVERRLAIQPRQPPGADFSALTKLCAGSGWILPDDDGVHALATDSISQAILSRGLLYPCQAIFSDPPTSELFRPIPYRAAGERWHTRYGNRPFVIFDGIGVLVNRSARPAELAMIFGLAQVVQRLNAAAPIRYLTEGEVEGISGHVAYRYRGLANASHGSRT
jgi:rhamnose utilization protein RhaD (predicted bifunctional aldolase and dehydrogenase)